MQFTLEELDSCGNLAFLDLNVNVDSGKKGHMWFVLNFTDPGTILNFRGSHLCSTNKNVIEGTVHRVFRNTATWESFDQALGKKSETMD